MRFPDGFSPVLPITSTIPEVTFADRELGKVTVRPVLSNQEYDQLVELRHLGFLGRQASVNALAPASDFDPDSSHVVAVTNKGKVVGGGSLVRRSPEISELRNLVTLPGVRQNVVGSAVIKVLEGAGADSGVSQIVVSADKVTRSLLEENGFGVDYSRFSNPYQIGMKRQVSR